MGENSNHIGAKNGDAQEEKKTEESRALAKSYSEGILVEWKNEIEFELIFEMDGEEK